MHSAQGRGRRRVKREFNNLEPKFFFFTNLGTQGECFIRLGSGPANCKVTEQKSYNYHVLMQQLLPIALKELLSKGPRLAISSLCAFFNLLSQRVIDREHILVKEVEIFETICLFERYVPQSFFDIIVL